MKIVIRAGGSGTRLWPLSRQKRPKQFLPLLSQKSLFEEKIIEIRPLLKHYRDLFVSVADTQVKFVQRLLPELPKENIIAEPAVRNTGSAIGLESVIVSAATRGKEDPVIASLTVDDVFLEGGAFREALRAANEFLEHHPLRIVALASSVATPDPGLSYIQVGRPLKSHFGQKFYLIRRWVEKPTGRWLTRLTHQNNIFAHTGQYIWKASTVLSLFEKHQPEIYRRLQTIQRAYGSKHFTKTLSREYRQLPIVSIEEAITNQVKNIAVVTGDFRWSDTGKWYLVKDLQASGPTNVIQGRALTVKVTDSLIYGPKKKLIGAVGLDGLIIVDTGDVLLVCSKKHSGDVKKLIESIKKHKLHKYL